MVITYTKTLLLEVFTERNFVADFIPLNWLLVFLKIKKSLYKPTFWALKGNVRTPSITHGKPVVDFLVPIRHN